MNERVSDWNPLTLSGYRYAADNFGKRDKKSTRLRETTCGLRQIKEVDSSTHRPPFPCHATDWLVGSFGRPLQLFHRLVSGDRSPITGPGPAIIVKQAGATDMGQLPTYQRPQALLAPHS
ncbi:hypothetical protein TWF751_006695 [Orbilia oligospora]|nr:hypothetical protein TWF751_006695 [Orbilia oligospora]